MKHVREQWKIRLFCHFEIKLCVCVSVYKNSMAIAIRRTVHETFYRMANCGMAERWRHSCHVWITLHNSSFQMGNLFMCACVCALDPLRYVWPGFYAKIQFDFRTQANVESKKSNEWTKFRPRTNKSKSNFHFHFIFSSSIQFLLPTSFSRHFPGDYFSNSHFRLLPVNCDLIWIIGFVVIRFRVRIVVIVVSGCHTIQCRRRRWTMHAGSTST